MSAVLVVGSLALAGWLVVVIRRKIFPSDKEGAAKSPLARDSRDTTVAPLEINFEERQKVLKHQVFKKEVAEEKWDAIVIGSGIGGLTAAALLAKAGRKVLVLEKHGKAGGACHVFKSDGYEFDVGIHYIGSFNRPTMSRTLLEQISRGQIRWQDMDNNFDTVVIDAQKPTQRIFNVPSGRGQWCQQLKNEFPGEEQAIDSFFEMVALCNKHQWMWMVIKAVPLWLVDLVASVSLWGRISHFFRLGSKTLQQVVESLTANEDLRLMMCYCWGTYFTPPSSASFALHSMLIGHYEYGASYPIGGASEIPYQIIPVIQSAGGRVLVKAPVTEILTDAGRTVGVRVSVGTSGHCDVLAPVVISDAGVHNTFLKLLPKELASTSPCYSVASTVPASYASLSVFIGLKGTAEELGLKAQNAWVFGGSHPEKFVHEFDELKLEDMMDRPYPAFFIGFASAKDPSWVERYPGRSTITVVTWAPYRWFETWAKQKVKKRDDEYVEAKNAIGHKIVEQICHLYPSLKNAIDHVSVGTPVTNEHYLNAHHGATYGMHHPLERFQPSMAARLRPDTKIEGLYLTGQDVITGGFTAALYAGLLSASSVLGRNLMADLISLHTELKKKA